MFTLYQSNLFTNKNKKASSVPFNNFYFKGAQVVRFLISSVLAICFTAFMDR